MEMTDELEEYLAEIREQVCSRCIERPEGGPPCAPLGKRCGIELNLRQLVDSVHGVHSMTMDQYAEHFHDEVCAQCPALDSEDCPCALKYLLLLAVQAIEDVDGRRAARSHGADD